jgi:dTDP-4-amino-4,6-dideoxygalactose transaminase
MAFKNIVGSSFKYPIQNTTKINLSYKDKFMKNFEEILESGNLILGKKAEELENKIKEYIGVKYCLGTSSGTSSLELAINSLDLNENDEIIIQGNTFIASAFGARFSKSKIIPTEVDQNGLLDIDLLENQINNNTKCVIVVPLYGDCCDMKKLSELCKKNNIFLIEDCAQAQGTKYNNRMIGSFGDISCFSFYPSKNLGALGDAGAICINNYVLYEKVKLLRNLGAVIKYQHDIKGGNYRIDALQCSFLLTKFNDIDEVIKKKQQVAKWYETHLNKNKYVHIKNDSSLISHSYHLFVIKLVDINRKKFADFLSQAGIETIVHYPVPFYKSKAYAELNWIELPIVENLAKNIISLPIDHLLEENDIVYICDIMNKFK